MGRITSLAAAGAVALACVAPALPARAQFGGSLVTAASTFADLCFENLPRQVFDGLEAVTPGLFTAYPPTTRCASLGMPVYAGDMAEATLVVRVYTSTEANAFVICAENGLVNCPTPAPVPAGYTDLWWNPAESGWGLSITHHTTGIAFLAWYIYDGSGGSQWYVAPNCRIGVQGRSCTDTLYATQGPPFPGAFDPSRVTRQAVGTITLSFSDILHGSFTYTLNGVTGTKAIQRQRF